MASLEWDSILTDPPYGIGINYGNGIPMWNVPKSGLIHDVFSANPDYSQSHPTKKPLALYLQLCRLIPGIILDPFMGSGTTLRAAKDLGRKAIGIEIEERYCEISAKRMAQEVLPL